ncbi:unnamed protein product [Mytilus coruscus]|uniref:Nucleotide-diphospho-sugar transferase domain-containing protein n=1 Tax=Mytilus coruscus TaxID=42192 RepID=A0A6J8CF94_MYTCO|nr:unnamed protein product [Mytilus coruscus]
MRRSDFKHFTIGIIGFFVVYLIFRHYVFDDKTPRSAHTYRKRPLHNDSNIALVVEAALQIQERPVLITLVNDGYVNLVKSWICNTKHMGFHKQVIMIVTSPQGTDEIKKLSPDVTVVALNVDQSMNGHQEYSHVGYLKIMVLRTQIQLALLQNDIEVYSFECDSVFLANPLHRLRAHSGEHDIVFISNYQRPKAINGGFLYLFPTPATKATFEQLNRMMFKLYSKIRNQPSDKFVPTFENDQVYLSNLVLEKYAGLKSTILPFSIFPDGKWYDISEEERKLTFPYLIHNNWIKGNKAKEGRAKMWRHWFLKDDGSCDFDLAKEVTKKIIY